MIYYVDLFLSYLLKNVYYLDCTILEFFCSWIAMGIIALFLGRSIVFIFADLPCFFVYGTFDSLSVGLEAIKKDTESRG